MQKVDCWKCVGRGEIRAFSGIAGGVCFACNGSGFLLRKEKARASVKWCVTAVPVDRSERGVVFYIRSKNAESALAVAVDRLRRGDAWRPETAAVEVAA